ncbi:MAG: sigma-54-dependent Fis family transcriptional regulator [Planctomycetota bacterium]|jgi:Nif-specific regulatory protein
MIPGLAILKDISKVIGSSLELNAVFSRIMQILAGELGIKRGRLVILNEMTGQLQTEVGHGLTDEELAKGIYAIGEGVTGSVYATGQPRVIPNVIKEPQYLNRTGSLLAEDQPFSFICLPITSEGQTIGVLSVDKPFDNQDVLNQDFGLLTIISTMISQTVRISNMVHREKEALVNKLAELPQTMHDSRRFSNIIGSSTAMMEVFKAVDRVAKTQATVLLSGETGTGKEMIAKAIHYYSHRGDRPFIRVNCGALSGQLLESELFGHVKGSFTGAIRDKIGRFQAAHGGTLFLDEIATLEVQLQVKLLRVLQEREFERVGDHQTISADVRIIAAANTDLAEEVKAKRFREDLYYRLNVVEIGLPPLRERRDDILLLIDHFLNKYNKANNRHLTKISRETLNHLMRYPWPGNVRELENVVERAVVLTQDENFTEDLLPPNIKTFIDQGKPMVSADSLEELMKRIVCRLMDQGGDSNQGKIWNRITSNMEHIMLSEALKRCNGVKIKAADFLGINRNTLNKKYNEMGLDGESSQDRME